MVTRPRTSLLAALLALAVVAPSAGALPEAEQRLIVSFADEPTSAEARARLGGLGAVTATLPEAGIWTVRPSAARAARAEALRRPRVRRAEWSLQHRSDELLKVPALPLPKKFATPRDPLFRKDRQWGLFGKAYWRPRVAARSVRPRIAVLDSGIDPGHEEWSTGSASGSPLAAGRSTIRASRRWQDWGVEGHGTHVAGVAAAPANGVGIVGVAPAVARQAEVIPVQIADRQGRSTDETMIKGIRWAVRRGARVVNISAGGPGYSSAFQEAIYWATERGAVIVASVGNEGVVAQGLVNYPAGYRRVIGVGAICDGNPATPDCESDPSGVAAFSSRNRTVDLVAPGVNVLSSVPRRVKFRVVSPGYALKDGTSMAAPFVSGAAALVFANHPKLSAYQVRRQLMNTATDIERPGRDKASGYGIVNPEAAARFAAPPDDSFEVNDTLSRAHRFRIRAGGRRTIQAVVDRHEDPTDLYAVYLERGDRLRARLNHRRGWVELRVWRPGVRRITRAKRAKGLLAVGGKRRLSRGAVLAVTRRAPADGIYYVDVGARRGVSSYRLVIERR
jgi:hypothetical protein